nr:sulfotransferase [Phaeobacter sp. HF9A]
MRGAFLLSASRSGSTMLSQILRMHPEVLSLSELLTMQASRALLPGHISGAAFWRQLSRPTPLLRQLANPSVAPEEFLYHRVARRRFDPDNCPPLLAVTLPHLFDDPDPVFDQLAPMICAAPRQRRADHYRHLFHCLAQDSNASLWIERSGGSLLAAPTLNALFPEAKKVLLLRDGRDTALSMQNYKPARFVIWMWKQARRAGVDVLSADAHLGRSRRIWLAELLGARLLPMRRIMAQPPSLQDCAAFWSAITLAGLRGLAQTPPEQLHVLRYEDIIEQPRPRLAGLADFLQISQDAAWLDAASPIPQPRAPRHRALPEQDREALDLWTAEARQAVARFPALAAAPAER